MRILGVTQCFNHVDRSKRRVQCATCDKFICTRGWHGTVVSVSRMIRSQFTVYVPTQNEAHTAVASPALLHLGKATKQAPCVHFMVTHVRESQ